MAETQHTVRQSDLVCVRPFSVVVVVTDKKQNHYGRQCCCLRKERRFCAFCSNGARGRGVEDPMASENMRALSMSLMTSFHSLRPIRVVCRRVCGLGGRHI